MKMKNKKNRSRSKPEYQIKIAKERIEILLKEADKAAKQVQNEVMIEERSSSSDKLDISLANRYVQLARKIGMRYNVRLSREQKRKFCQYCYAYLLPGKTSEHKIKNGFVHIKCLSCGRTKRIAYKRR